MFGQIVRANLEAELSSIKTGHSLVYAKTDIITHANVFDRRFTGPHGKCHDE
jgi:hypothetical protein